MSNAYTSTSAVSNAVVTAYDKAFEFGLRAQPMFRPIADKRPVSVTNPGESVVFNLYSDLAVATTPLSETVDPDAVALSNTSQVTVTLNEYGNVALMTRRLKLDALTDVEAGLANAIAWNVGDTVDALVQAVLAGGTNVLREESGTTVENAGARNLVTGTDVIGSKHIRRAIAKLRTNKAVPRRGTLYWCGMHPQVSHDLRKETGAGSWRQPHEYQAGAQIWGGELGEYEGAFFVENPRCTSDTGGTASARVFNTYLAGQQALAEAVNEEPHMVIGEITDKLKRFRPIGWYGFLGWSVYRQASLMRLETTSSVNNA